MPSAYAVVDVETNGCRADADRVIEVAVVRVERRRIVDRWRTLLRPDRPIPRWITRLTGISEDDVADAPAFDEVAGELVRRMRGAVFVAHNAAFDARFLRAEFTRAARDWSPPILCTVRLARRLLPGVPGHSLDMLAAHFFVEIRDRHRALGDAEATAEILLRLLAMRGARTAAAKLTSRRVPAIGLPEGADALPRGRGAWVVRAADGRALATGRAINLYEKFRDDWASLPKRVARAASRVEFEECPSDVEAQAAEQELALNETAGRVEGPVFLTVTAAGEMRIGPPGPGRIHGPFPSEAELRRRLKRAKGCVEEAVRGLRPLGLFRGPAGPGVLVREDDRLVWVCRGRLRRAWPLGPDTDEEAIRGEIRAMLEAPFDEDSAPRVKASRGVPVEAFLG